MENRFIALGGGASIGNSCYYLEVDGCRLLLDCGALLSGRGLLQPNLELLTKRYVEGLWQLDGVVLSHAHFDHLGALGSLFKEGVQLPIWANPITKILAELQLTRFDKLEQLYRSPALHQTYLLHKAQALQSIRALPFNQPLRRPHFTLTLYKAGHIPGAAMVYVETAGHRVLYTGDFSCQKGLLAAAYQLPEHLPVDLLILNGTHAYGKESYAAYTQAAGPDRAYQRLLGEIAGQVKLGRPVLVATSNAAKGIELARVAARQLPQLLGLPLARAVGQPQMAGGQGLLPALGQQQVQGDGPQLPLGLEPQAQPVEHQLPQGNRPVLKLYLDEGLQPFAEAFETAHFQVYGPQLQPLPKQLRLEPGMLIFTRDSEALRRRFRCSAYGAMDAGVVAGLRADVEGTDAFANAPAPGFTGTMASGGAFTSALGPGFTSTTASGGAFASAPAPGFTSTTASGGTFANASGPKSGIDSCSYYLGAEPICLNGNCFTLHASCTELAELVERLQPQVVFLTHTEPQFTCTLQDMLARRRTWQGSFYQVYDEAEYQFT